MHIGTGTPEVVKNRSKRAVEAALNILRSSSVAPYIEDALLYGSAARGTQTYKSDIDILVQLSADTTEKIGEGDLKREERYLRCRLAQCENGLPEADVKFVLGNEWKRSGSAFFENIRREGETIWH